MTCISSVEVKKAWSCAFSHPLSFMACAGTVLPFLPPTVFYYLVCNRTFLCGKELSGQEFEQAYFEVQNKHL